MGFFNKPEKDNYDDKQMDKVLTFADIAIELSKELPNASNIRVDTYGINLTFFKPGEKPAVEVSMEKMMEPIVVNG